MNLYLHIGTEKTGSSYLQYLCANNRPYLLQNQIYFPSAGIREMDMKSGAISPGNGKQLFEAFEKGYEKVYKLLNRYKTNALQNSADAILLTNENLIEQLCKKECIKILLQVSDHLNIVIQPMLVILRDPVNQAISLYKHRAKRGTVGNVEQWVKHGYHLDKQLSGLSKIREKFDVTLKFRKYNRSDNTLEGIFFEDWLQITTPAHDKSIVVNPSLTLSELNLQRQLFINAPDVCHLYYKKMSELKNSDKASDKQYESLFKRTISKHLINHTTTWEWCNKQLPASEQIELPDEGAGVEESTVDSVAPVFSDSQLEVLSKVISESRTLKFAIKNKSQKLKARLLRFIPDNIVRKLVILKYKLLGKAF